MHLSVFLKPSGKGKMSKREAEDLSDDGYSIFLNDLQSLGYIPEAVVNWIALMGWSYDDHTEFFTLKDLVEKFRLDRLNPAPAAINFSKLDHFDGLHIRQLSTDDLARRIEPFLDSASLSFDFKTLLKITPLIQERITTLDEVPDWIGFFFKEKIVVNPQDLIGAKMTAAESAFAARRVYAVLKKLDSINLNTAEPPLRGLAVELGLKAGQLFGILRVAITGRTVSPPLFESMEILGKRKVLERLSMGIEILERIID